MGKDNMSTPATPPTMAVELPVDANGDPLDRGYANMVATADGRLADTRPISDADVANYVPEHVAENYRAICAERHGGDFTRLADRFETEAATALDTGRPADWRPLMALAHWARGEHDKGTEATTPHLHAVMDPDAPPTGPTTPDDSGASKTPVGGTAKASTPKS